LHILIPKEYWSVLDIRGEVQGLNFLRYLATKPFISFLQVKERAAAASLQYMIFNK